MRCGYCQRLIQPGDLHMDHVVPRSRGGPDRPHNLVAACSACNSAKTDRLPSEWLAKVPPMVAEIERRVCAAVEVSIRSRRGRRSAPVVTKRTTLGVRCDCCTDDITLQPHEPDWHVGMLRWWPVRSADGRDRVGMLRIYCSRCYAVDTRERVRDFALESYFGPRATEKALSMVALYDFEEEDRAFLVTVFDALRSVGGEVTP